MQIYKNPVFIAVCASILTFLYIRWQNNKKQQQTGETPKMNLLPVLVVGLIVWLISHCYFYQSFPVDIASEHTTKSFHLIESLHIPSDCRDLSDNLPDLPSAFIPVSGFK